jgi:hypothetical protein
LEENNPIRERVLIPVAATIVVLLVAAQLLFKEFLAVTVYPCIPLILDQDNSIIAQLA